MMVPPLPGMEGMSLLHIHNFCPLEFTSKSSGRDISFNKMSPLGAKDLIYSLIIFEQATLHWRGVAKRKHSTVVPPPSTKWCVSSGVDHRVAMKAILNMSNLGVDRQIDCASSS